MHCADLLRNFQSLVLSLVAPAPTHPNMKSGLECVVQGLVQGLERGLVRSISAKRSWVGLPPPCEDPPNNTNKQ